MQLREGSSLWLAEGKSTPGSGPVTANMHCEVAIIGGGITGALVAEHLIRAGVDVLALDRRAAGSGSTSASTGLIQYELDTTLLELIARRGPQEALAAYRLCASVLTDFPHYLETLKVSCDLQLRESLYLAQDASELHTFKEETLARQSCGIDAHLLSSDEVMDRFGIRRPGAIVSPEALAINPYQVSLGLWQKAIQGGLRLHTPATITRYDADDAGVTLHTEQDYQVRARKVVFATGYETPAFLDVPVKLSTTFAIASQPGIQRPGASDHPLIWESARPYLYVRSGPENRLIVGGEDEPWHGGKLSKNKVHDKASVLVDKAGQLYPQVELHAAYAWSGIFAQTEDGLPYIGANEKFPHGFFALGYGGNGILFSFLAARIIRNLFMATPCDEAALFRFNRHPV